MNQYKVDAMFGQVEGWSDLDEFAAALRNIYTTARVSTEDAQEAVRIEYYVEASTGSAAFGEFMDRLGDVHATAEGISVMVMPA